MDSSESNSSRSILMDCQWSDDHVMFVSIGHEISSFNDIDSEFSFLNEENNYIPFSYLTKKKGIILGKFFNSEKFEYLLIELLNGEKIKYKRKSWEITLDILPPYLCNNEEILTAKEFIGRTIWLNKTTNFLYPTTSSFFTDENISFKRFEEVRVIDLYLFYNGGTERPIWLKIKSLEGSHEGFVKYNMIDRTEGYFENYYFSSNPFLIDWDPVFISEIKNGNILMGMTKKQVQLSWGNPTKIIKKSLKTDKIDSWIYSRFIPGVVNFEDGKVIGLEN